MRPVRALLLVAVLAGCGTPPGLSQASPPARPTVAFTTPVASTGSASGVPVTPSPDGPWTPSPKLLFAVTESPSYYATPNTVAIVGMDGYARAKAKFTPTQGAYVPDAAVIIQEPVQVVGDRAYYIDGNGVIRVLKVGASPAIVATFTQKPTQYATWFAVRPDGAGVLAGVLSFPAVGPTTPGSPWPEMIGGYKFDLKSSPVGGPAVTLAHREASTVDIDSVTTWRPIFPVAWTADGAVVMYPVHVITQDSWYGGPLYVVDSYGKEIRELGGEGCNSSSLTPGGLVACSGETVTIRDQVGKAVWATNVEGYSSWQVRVSPDGRGISNGYQVETRDLGTIALPVGFIVEGWLDSHTVIGRVNYTNSAGNLGWISLSSPKKIHDLGFKGDFISTVRS